MSAGSRDRTGQAAAVLNDDRTTYAPLLRRSQRDLDALRRLGEVLQRAVRKHGLLAELIRGAEPEWPD
jgi:hypothetical protein